MTVTPTAASVWPQLEPVLTGVRKPARYVGGEGNAVVKDHAGVTSAWLLIYPDAYELGQPNQGLQILYEVLNERPATVAERGYAPWPDMEQVMREKAIPFFRLENHLPLRAFDVAAFSLATELGYTNLLNCLDLGGLAVAGADHVDERRHRLGVGRRVPAWYEPGHSSDGRLRGTFPRQRAAPYRVPKRTVSDLDRWPYPKKAIVRLTETVHERYNVEIFRGGTRGCCFCQAGMTTRPVRERSRQTIKEMVRRGVEATGFEDAGVVGPAQTEQADLLGLCGDLADAYEGTATSLSLPSTRVDAFNVTLADELIRNGRRTGLTFAPEVGSERVRRVINKMVSEADMLRAADTAFANRWRPPQAVLHDRPADRDRRRRARRRRPGAEGPGRRPPVRPPQQGHRLGRRLRAQAAQAVPVGRPGNAAAAAAQARPHQGPGRGRAQPEPALPPAAAGGGGGAAGPRRPPGDGHGAARVPAGARFDGWDEHFDYGVWARAAEQTGVDVAWYTTPQRGEGGVFPWDHLDSGLEKDWLWRDWCDALAGSELEDCRWTPCYDCGVCPGLGPQHQTGHLPIYAGPR